MKTEMIKKIAVQMLAAWVLVIGLAAATSAATITVNTLIDENNTGAACSLREAMTAANNDAAFGGCPAGAGDDTIIFAGNVTGTINLTGELPAITGYTTIQGPGAFNLEVRRDTGGNYRIFTVLTNVALYGLSISNGNRSGISNQGTLTVRDCYLFNNSQPIGNGGGISNNGNLLVQNSTFVSNSAAGGGAISGDPTGSITIQNSTLAFNSANQGGAILSTRRLTVQSCTIRDNTASQTGGISAGFIDPATLGNNILSNNRNGNLAGGFSGINSQGYNLSTDGGGFLTATGDQINTPAGLSDVLANNGGSTPTYGLLDGSAALDKGKSFGLTTDQRGFRRPFDVLNIANAPGGDGADIGAWEASPPPLIVTKTDDTNDGACDADCSLREAITAANSGPGLSLINFAPNVTGTIQLTSALPDLTTDIELQGPGARVLTVRRDTGGNYRIFNVNNGTTQPGPNDGPTVTISGLSIVNGLVSGNGGGIRNSRSTLIVNDCTFIADRADRGGAVSNYNGSVTINRSTLTGNRSNASNSGGGGIYTEGFVAFAETTVNNSTLSGNSAINGGSGGAVRNNANQGNATTTLNSCTLFGNSATTGSSVSGVAFDASGAVRYGSTIFQPAAGDTGGNFVQIGNPANSISLGYNLSSANDSLFLRNSTDRNNTNPLLGPLQDNGGQTDTHALLAGSPAIDKGNSFGLNTDQRGAIRPYDFPSIPNASGGDGADIGAFELQPALTVTKTADTNDGACDADCSLREAIAAATSVRNMIEFASPLFDAPQTIILNGTELLIDKSLTVSGTGANLLTVSANEQSRVFSITNNVTVSLSGMTITGGRTTSNSNDPAGGGIANFGTLTVSNCHVTANNAFGPGGGILNGTNKTLTVLNSTVSNNTAGSGGFGISGAGGISSTGALTVTNSTVSGNVKNGGNSNAGGISSFGTATITSSTITDNNAAGVNSAGGLKTAGGAITIRNTIVAANRSNTTLPDVAGAFTSEDYNLIGNRGTATGFSATGDQTGTGASPLNPLLGTLADNGGTTPTHALLSGSPALDKGNSFGLTADQRGSPRPLDNASIPNASGGDGSDIGALEQQSAIAEIGIEGDVAQRPDGDGTVLSDDVVLVRRFLNGSQTFGSTTNEFQRADSAPVNTRGDGVLDSTDIVQTRRYQNGSSAMQNAGGPIAPSSGGTPDLPAEFNESESEAKLTEETARQMRVQSTAKSTGRQVTVNILVDAAGDESEYGFILNYDANALSRPTVGAGSAGAAVRACNTAVSGRINCSVGGFADDMNQNGIGEIASGINQILITVTFTITANASVEMTPLTLENVNVSNDAARRVTINSQFL